MGLHKTDVLERLLVQSYMGLQVIGIVLRYVSCVLHKSWALLSYAQFHW